MAEREISVFWFRRDLRLDDNHGLFRALQSGSPVLPLFIFDRNILSELPRQDARVEFIQRELMHLKQQLERDFNSSMLLRYGNPLQVWEELTEKYEIAQVFCNRDYEPYARQRDKQVFELLRGKGIDFKGYKDHVLLEKDEVVKADGNAYTVFTPYMRRFKEVLRPEDLEPFDSLSLAQHFLTISPQPGMELQDLGFLETGTDFPSRNISPETIIEYHRTRDYPAQPGTSRLGIHLRFGTISIRKLALVAQQSNNTFFNELIWREFYQMILYHFPQTVTKSFKPKYDRINWENDPELFEKWKEGKTGFPLVDAGMRELNVTGFMHNRVRMLTASFLTKHLLIDWRWGEAYFAEKLLDYEQASNVGGWQWAAGSGVDAAPYFRVFNPHLQLGKFDKELQYVRKWVPEYGTADYPEPVVDHKAARERALQRFKAALA